MKNTNSNKDNNTNKIKVSINERIPRNADKHEAAKYAKGWELIDVPFNEESLTELLTTNSYMPSKLKDGTRKKENVEEAYFLPLDFDDGITIKEFQQTADSWNFCWFLIPTASHQKNKGGKVSDRFRVFIPFSRPVSMEEMRKMEQYFLSIFPSLDTGSFHAERYFYKSPSDADTYFHNPLDKYGNAKFFDPYIALKYAQEKPEEKKARRGRPRKEPEKTFSKNTELKRYDGTTIIAGDVTEKTKIFCPFCTQEERGNPDKDNAFIDVKKGGRLFIFCSSENKKFWQDADELGRFSVSNNEESYGYYEYVKDGEPVHLCNFKIDFCETIIFDYEHEKRREYAGEVLFGNGHKYEFLGLSAKDFAEPNKFKAFLSDLCGTDVLFNKSTPSGIGRIIEAVKHFNKDVPVRKAIELGYNLQMTEYYTQDFVITASGINPQTSYLKYPEAENLNLIYEIEDEQYEYICSGITYDLPEFAGAENVLPGLAFTMAPVIASQLETSVSSLPYMNYYGQSGSGKTTLVSYFQSFYGYHKELTSITSTPYSLAAIGNAYKDSLLVLDDFKPKNFGSINEMNKFYQMLQNIGDRNGRRRLTKDMKLREKQHVKGLVMLSGESLPLEETSAMGRNIAIELTKNQNQPKKLQLLKKMQPYFSAVTTRYIQYVFNNYDRDKISVLYEKNLFWLTEETIDINKDYENVPRTVGNLALLKTSWDVWKEFFYKDNEDLLKEHDKKFNESLLKLLNDNIILTAEARPDLRFIECLISLLESNQLIIYKYHDSEEVLEDKRVVGYFKEDNGNEILVINITKAHKEVNDFYRDQGGIGDKYALMDKLHADNLISEKRPVQQRIGYSIGGKLIQRRGVRWLDKELIKKCSSNPEDDFENENLNSEEPI